DVHMPRLDGLAATRAIMRQVPTPILIVSASARDDDLAMSFGALEAGALAVVEKPANPGDPTFERQAERLRAKVHLMAGGKPWRARGTIGPLELAGGGRKAEGARVYIASHGVQLERSRHGARGLPDADPVGGHRPSADRLFRSGAERGIPAADVIRTGMGRDG